MQKKIAKSVVGNSIPLILAAGPEQKVERVEGIEPSSPAWKASC